MALIGSYGLGVSSSVAAGTLGWRRTISPIAGDLDAARSNPSLTLAARLGKHLEKRRFASMFVGGFNLSMERDSWVVLEADLNGTGKNSTNLKKDTITAAWNAASLALTAAIAGSTAQERLDNCHYVRALDPVGGQWVDVVVTVASDAIPCILTITPPGGTATSTTYEVIFNQAETGGNSWCSFPNRVEEYPLRVSDFLVKMGAKWDGSTLTGGHQMAAEINSLKWNFNQNLTPDFTPGGGTYSYANRALRKPRAQTVSLDRRFLDFIIGQRFTDIEYFSLYGKAEGAEYEAGHKYTIEVLFPRVSVKGRPIAVADSRLVERAEFDVFQDDTYGSAILWTKNKVQNYAQ
jgi:hypothetical protein